jgi:hypothetical protein
MKSFKIISTVIFALVCTVSSAQIQFGVKAGINAAKAGFSTDDLRSDYITGYHVGPLLEAMVGKGGIGFDLAVLYSTKGFTFNDAKIRTSAIEVPLNLKFKFGIPVLNPFIAAGPYIDLSLDDGKVWDIGKETIDKVKSKSFGAGLNFALGAELFSLLQLSFTYSYGLTDNYSTFDASNVGSYKGKSHSGALSVALMF